MTATSRPLKISSSRAPTLSLVFRDQRGLGAAVAVSCFHLGCAACFLPGALTPFRQAGPRGSLMILSSPAVSHAPARPAGGTAAAARRPTWRVSSDGIRVGTLLDCTREGPSVKERPARRFYALE